MADRKKRRLGAAQLKINRTNDRFKPGTFFVSAIILREKRELTSKAASKNVLLDWSLVVKNKKSFRRCFSYQIPTTAKRSPYRPCELFPVRSPYFF